MSLNFPTSPSNNQIYFDSISGNRYKYNATNNVWFFVANNDIQGSSLDTQVVFNDGNSANGSVGLTFNKTANTLTANTINAFSMRVTGNLYIGSNTVVISNNSISAQTLEVTTMIVGGSAVPTGQQSNAVYDLVNAAFTVANSAYALQNNDYTMSNAAYTVANAAFGLANTTYAAVNSAFAVINAVYTSSNADYVVTNAAYTVANAAFGTANGKVSKSGDTITGTLSIVGDLVVSGNTYQLNANTMSVSDPLIYLAANNYSSDIVDIGFIANYVNTAGANVHTGLYREHENKEYYLFQGYDREPINNHIGAMSNNMTLSVLNADIRTSNLNLGSANAIVWIKSAYDTVNAAYTSSNSDYVVSNAAFGVANAAYGQVNTLATSANAYAASVGTSTNNYTSATYSTLTQLGQNWAVTNAAFGVANTALQNTSGITFAGDLYFPSGNVVVGVNSASADGSDFEVQRANATILVHYSGSSRGGIQAFTGQRMGLVTTTSGDNLVFGYTSGVKGTFTEYMRIKNSNGYVGIGNTNPASALTVSGSGFFSGITLNNRAGVDIGFNTNYAFLTSGDRGASTLNRLDFEGSSFRWLFGFGASEKMQLDTSGNLLNYTSVRAPIFYDYDDTYFYVNPNSTSRIYDLSVYAGAIYFQSTQHKRITSNDGGGNWNFRAGNYMNSGTLQYINNGSGNSGAASITFSVDQSDGVIALYTAPIAASGNTVSFTGQASLDRYGTWYANGDLRSPVYYDYDNTGYYINGAATSTFNAISTSTIAASGSWGTYLNPTTAAVRASGSYGGAYALIDGSYGITLYSIAGSLNFGFGSNTSVASKAVMDGNGNLTAGIVSLFQTQTSTTTSTDRSLGYSTAWTTHLSLTFTTTRTGSVYCGVVFAMTYEAAAVVGEAQFYMTGSTNYTSATMTVAQQSDANRARGAHSMTWVFGNVPAGTYTLNLQVRNNGSGSTWILNNYLGYDTLYCAYT